MRSKHSMLRRQTGMWLLTCALLLSSACETPSNATDATPAPGTDATGPGTDAGATDSGADRSLTVLELSNGETRTGELIAVYDRNRWWDNPGPELFYGLFNPELFSAFPDDRSVEVVSSLQVAALTETDWPAGRPDYRSFARNRNFVLDALPLTGTNMIITGNESYHLEENGYGDFAFDFTRSDTKGARCTGGCAVSARPPHPAGRCRRPLPACPR